MSLHTTGEISVDVDRQTAFAVVKDPDRLARCIPGCENLQELGSDKYSAVLTSKVAFLTLRFKVVIDVIRMDPPSAIEAKNHGRRDWAGRTRGGHGEPGSDRRR